RRCTRPMRRHVRTPSTARDDSSSCCCVCNWGHVMQGRPAATITRSPSAQPVTPAPSLAIVPAASWPCVTTGSCGEKVPLMRLRSEWQISHNAILEDLAWAGLGYRNILHRNCFGVGLETLGPHRVNYFAPFAA